MDARPHRSPVVAVALVLLAVTSCATLRSWVGLPEWRMPPEYPEPDASVPWVEAESVQAPARIEGPLLRAVHVAVDDLAHRFGHPEGDELYRCLSRLDAYDVTVLGEDADQWIISVAAREWRCWDGGGAHLMDAGAVYFIGKKDFAILAVHVGA